ncbi:MAG: hypothetical protein IKG58_01625 [Bacilli bacterium]|nr:hypothetical protein [Bacilli bacterium]MBR3049245.1 hypothetical protein [Bacilli bacterium]
MEEENKPEVLDDEVEEVLEEKEEVLEEPVENTETGETPAEESTVEESTIPEETPVGESTIEEPNIPAENPVEELPTVEETSVENTTPIETTLNETLPSSTIEEVGDATDKPKKKGKKKPIIVFIILLLLVGIGVGVYFYLTNSQKESVTTPEKQSAYRISSNDLTDFDLKFLQIENKDNNKIYSPLSIKYALAMLKEGANGDSKDQITDIIGDYKAKKYNNNKNMSFANAMFIKDSYKDSVKVEYTDNLKEKYNAEVIYDSFKTPDALNKWVSEKTFNLIKDLFDDSVSKYDFVLTNALAIDMNWNYQIQCASGSKVQCLDYGGGYDHEKGEDGYRFTWAIPIIFDESDYHSLKFDGKDNIKSAEIGAVYNRYNIVKELGEDKIRKTVSDEYKKWLNTEDGKNWTNDNPEEKDVDKYVDGFIKDLKENYNKSDKSSDFLFHDDKNVKVFAKDLKTYDGTTLQYVGIMPKNEDLDKYVEKTNAKKLNKIIKNLKELKKESFKDGVVTIIKGYIPFFKFDYTLELKKDLQKLGIKNVFEEGKADLSNLTKKEAFIDSASHKANIEFSNDGIKAAAATEMGGLGSTSGGFDYLFDVPIEKIDLTFDKPYMFIIRDKNSGEVWFTGTVYEPIEKNK